MSRNMSLHNKTILGKLVIKKLICLNKNQNWLSEQTGISKQHICNVLRGKENFSLNAAIKIANCLDLDKSVVFKTILEMKQGDEN